MSTVEFEEFSSISPIPDIVALASAAFALILTLFTFEGNSTV